MGQGPVQKDYDGGASCIDSAVVVGGRGVQWFWPKRLLFFGAILGGAETQDIPGVLAAKVAGVEHAQREHSPLMGTRMASGRSPTVSKRSVADCLTASRPHNQCPIVPSLQSHPRGPPPGPSAAPSFTIDAHVHPLPLCTQAQARVGVRENRGSWSSQRNFLVPSAPSSCGLCRSPLGDCIWGSACPRGQAGAWGSRGGGGGAVDRVPQNWGWGDSAKALN